MKVNERKLICSKKITPVAINSVKTSQEICISPSRDYRKRTETPLHSGRVGRSLATLEKRIPINHCERLKCGTAGISRPERSELGTLSAVATTDLFGVFVTVG